MSLRLALPPEVLAASERAAARGFRASSGDVVGPLLAALAAAVPEGGRVLEIGTGCGVGLAWIISGLRERLDVNVVTIEADHDLAAVVRDGAPGFVDVRTGRFEDLHAELGDFDLVFADAEGGKWTDFHLTRNLVRPGGILVLDDLDETRYTEITHRAAVAAVVKGIQGDDRFVVAELPLETGLLLATRRRSGLGA